MSDDAYTKDSTGIKHHNFGALLRTALPPENPYLPKNDVVTSPGLSAALPTAITPAINRTAEENCKVSAKNLDSSMFDYHLEEETPSDTAAPQALKNGNDGKAKTDEDEDEEQITALREANLGLKQAHLLPEAPLSKHVLPNGELDWTSLLQTNLIQHRMPSTQIVAGILELQNTMQEATAHTKQWADRNDLHLSRDASWIPPSFRFNQNKFGVRFSDLLKGTPEAEEISREALIGTETFIAHGKSMIGRAIKAELDASIKARLTMYCKKLLAIQWAHYTNLRTSTELSGQLDTNSLGKVYMQTFLQIAVLDYLKTENRPHYLEYLQVPTREILLNHFVAYACPAGTDIAQLEKAKRQLNATEAIMLLLLTLDLTNIAYTATVYKDYQIRVNLLTKANDAAIIAANEADAIIAATEATAIALAAGNLQDHSSNSDPITKGEAAELRSKLAEYEKQAAKTIASYNKALKGRSAGKQTRVTKNTYPRKPALKKDGANKNTNNKGQRNNQPAPDKPKNAPKTNKTKPVSASRNLAKHKRETTPKKTSEQANTNLKTTKYTKKVAKDKTVKFARPLKGDASVQKNEKKTKA
jgi:hypothetical protein